MKADTIYASDLALCLESRLEQGITLGSAEMECCISALKYYAAAHGKGKRRLKSAALAALALLPLLACLGFADLNGDGTSTFADVAAGRNPLPPIIQEAEAAKAEGSID